MIVINNAMEKKWCKDGKPISPHQEVFIDHFVTSTTILATLMQPVPLNGRLGIRCSCLLVADIVNEGSVKPLSDSSKCKMKIKVGKHKFRGYLLPGIYITRGRWVAIGGRLSSHVLSLISSFVTSLVHSQPIWLIRSVLHPMEQKVPYNVRHYHY